MNALAKANSPQASDHSLAASEPLAGTQGRSQYMHLVEQLSGGRADCVGSPRHAAYIDLVKSWAGAKRHRHTARLSQSGSDFDALEAATEPDLGMQAAPQFQVPRYVEPVALPPSHEQFVSTMEWDGYVTDIEPENLRAVVYPVGSTDRDEELVEIPLSLVDTEIRPHLERGAVFRLATGHFKHKRTTIIGTKIYFRTAARFKPRGNVTHEALQGLFD